VWLCFFSRRSRGGRSNFYSKKLCVWGQGANCQVPNEPRFVNCREKGKILPYLGRLPRQNSAKYPKILATYELLVRKTGPPMAPAATFWFVLCRVFHVTLLYEPGISIYEPAKKLLISTMADWAAASRRHQVPECNRHVTPRARATYFSRKWCPHACRRMTVGV
jgi:hypothetical protein